MVGEQIEIPWVKVEDGHSIHWAEYRATCIPEAQDRGRDVYEVTVYVNKHPVVNKRIKSIEKAKQMAEKTIARFVMESIPEWLRPAVRKVKV